MFYPLCQANQGSSATLNSSLITNRMQQFGCYANSQAEVPISCHYQCYQWRTPSWTCSPENSCIPVILSLPHVGSNVIYSYSSIKLPQVCWCSCVLFNSQFGNRILMDVEFWVDSFIFSFSIGKFLLHFLWFSMDSAEKTAIL